MLCVFYLYMYIDTCVYISRKSTYVYIFVYIYIYIYIKQFWGEGAPRVTARPSKPTSEVTLSASSMEVTSPEGRHLWARVGGRTAVGASDAEVVPCPRKSPSPKSWPWEGAGFVPFQRDSHFGTRVHAFAAVKV